MSVQCRACGESFTTRDSYIDHDEYSCVRLRQWEAIRAYAEVVRAQGSFRATKKLDAAKVVIDEVLAL